MSVQNIDRSIPLNFETFAHAQFVATCYFILFKYFLT